MKETAYVDRLFAGYDDTPEIKDFKEEVTANLAERIRGLVANGLGEEQAFEKATAELGDITAIADEVGKKRRNEAIGRMYMGAKVPLAKRTAAGLTAASGLLLLAAGLALIAFFGGWQSVAAYNLSAILLSLACGLYAYFGLTQETAAHYAMKSRRALAYGAVCLAGFLGTGLAVVSFLSGGSEMTIALGVKIAFMLPAICGLVFLLATEPKRQKPWLEAMVKQEIEKSMDFHRDMVDPAKAARFGVMSVGLWILAAALFATLSIAVGWRHSWLVFLFALAAQVFMAAMIFERQAL